MNPPSLPRPVRLRTVLLTVAAAFAVGLAPQTSSAQQRGLGVIAGTALDSLHGTPLPRALVTIAGVGLSATTDEEGEFRIDSVPAGEHRIAVFHPLLDTLGITLLTPPLRVVADSTTDLIVAVPSASTVLALKCGPGTHTAVLGVVARADDPEPPRGAQVLLRWTEVQIGRAIGVRNLRRNLAVPVAADGTFRMCGVEPGVVGELAALANADTTAAVNVSFEEWPVLVIIGFVLAGEDVEQVAVEPSVADDEDAVEDVSSGFAAVPGATLRRGRALISGIVLDSLGALLGNARVSLAGAVGAAVTGEDGRFFLREQPSGSGLLVARRLGLAMAELPVVVSAHGRNEFTIRMTSRVASLAEIVVQANRQVALERVGFYSRVHRKRGSLFLDLERMDAMANRASLANVLADASNLTYRQGQIFGRHRPPRVSVSAARSVSMQSQYSCVAYVLDGQYWPKDFGAPTDFLLPNEVGAIEVYRAGEVPPDLPWWHHVRGCEAVVIWTRHHLKVP